MKSPSKPPVPQKPPSAVQIPKANARRAAEGLPPLDADGKIPKPAFNRAKLAEKVEAIMTAPRTVKKARKGKRK